MGFFIMHTVYVIYSKTLDKYYIGETENVKESLVQHDTKFFNSAYTGLTSDWKLFFSLEVQNRALARKIETHIKRMKSKKHVENLKIYPSISEKLLKMYS
jgi:putative endonuclease